MSFGSTPAASYVVDTPLEITAISPSLAAGTVNITVTTPSGTSPTVSADRFTAEAAPSVSGLSPIAGPLSGNGTVVITGTGFTGASSVNFGATAATYAVDSTTQITATSPGQAAGMVDVTVTTPGGSSAISPADEFTYESAPSITALAPIAGPIAGGSTVTITGTDFTGASAVSFGSSPGIITLAQPTRITAVSPAGSAGVVDITVTTPSGTSATSAADEFTYEAAPTVTAVSPVAGPLAGGTTVTLTGTSFTGLDGVSFGSSAATSYTFESAHQATAVSPGESAGTVDITVTTPSGPSATNPPADQFTFEAAPAVSAVSPIAGPIAGGTAVTITGTGFAGASSLSFGSVPATSYAIVSATEITAVSPAEGAGAVDVQVTTPAGPSAISPADQFTYQAAPSVTGINPVAGQLSGGASVTVTGTGLLGTTKVMFGSVAAVSYSVVSATAITAVSPAQAPGAVDVTVTTTSGTSGASAADQFTYEVAPAITAISPVAGPLTGGTSVTISGSNFTGASGVSFGSAAAASYSVVSATQIIATTPVEAAGSVSVTVTTPIGTSAITPVDRFSYEAAPSVTSVSPVAGPLGGGSAVILGGTGFTGASIVDFGTVAAATYSVVSPTAITVTTPAGSDGPVDVTVTTPVGTSAVNAPADQFTYEGAPVVSAVTPVVGPLTGGTTVTITGTGFTGASAVSFGAVAASSYVIGSATQITAISPLQALGTIDVTVTSSSGTSATSPADQFSYEATPSVSAVSPISGPLGGGTSVTVTGSDFSGASAVSFGSVGATSYSVVSATEITVTSPAGSAGIVDVTVTSSSGTSTLSAADEFTYEAGPSVTSVSPVAGLPAGGTAVTITGTSFVGASAVSFGTSAASYSVVSATSITATSPAGSGSVDVTVTTPAGTSATSSADQFTYEGSPAVSSLSPVAGLATGGTAVTITGTSFTGASTVDFGPTAASSFTVVSSSEITVASPAESAGVVQVTVTTPVGTSATSSADEFTYEPAPSVSAVSPVAGLPAGGTVVAVAGTGFNGASAVDFDTTAAASYTVNSATSITAVSPAESVGTADVIVTTPVGVSTTSPADHFTYESAPTIDSVSPLAGPTSGGTSVTITGTGFGAVSAVDFGTSPATITASSSTSITVSAPAGSGTVDLSVTTPVGTSAATAADLFIYEAAPAVTALSPTAGLLTGGATVTITGANFVDASGVSFGSVPASAYTVVSPTQIIAISSPQAAGTVDVSVTTPVATSAVSASDEFTYEAVPSVSALSPTAGLPAGGTPVTITGAGFTGASAVSFGTTSASTFSVVSSTEITVSTPPQAAATVDVTVTTPAGTSATSLSDEFTYETAPVVSSISPTSGTAVGGTVVTLTGSNFTGTSSVDFDTTAATAYTVVSSTEITVISPAWSLTPPETAMTIDLTVTTPVATSATGPADQFTYEAVPNVTALSPTAGLPAGGSTVIISGSNFTGATRVNFGTTSAAFSIDSATQITATSPAEPAGTVDVSVVTPVGTSATVLADEFTYETAPTLSSVSPVAGLPAGGGTVTISGTNFTDASVVDFGTTAATSYTVVSSTEITAVFPAGSGTVDVTVTTPLGSSAVLSADLFTYQAAPSVVSISPIAGPLAGGTTVTITGTNFTGASGISFGSIAATSYTFNSATQLTAASPSEGAGTVDVTVTTPIGTSGTSAADQFTYEAAPSISALDPIAGPLGGASTVIITGTGLVGASAVHFGATAASSYVFNSPTQITAVSPPHSAATVNVRVTTPAGTSGTSAADQFTYEAAPVVSAVGPVVGPLTGGTAVTVTGTGFVGASAVSFGATSATSFTVNSATQITAASPLLAEGTVDITVTTPSGTSATGAADQFTYESVPSVTAVVPIAGPLGGGTPVIITGTRFSGASAVSFGSNTAGVYSVVSATEITATSPAGSAGIVDVSVTSSSGTSASTSADRFTYEAAPTVTSVSPVAGLPAGGTAVTITGTSFVGASAVDFGTSAASYSVVSATSITATSPAGSDSVDVTVTTPAGTSATSSADQFTYEGVPTLSALSPVAGLATGGTPVTISGSDFTGASTVDFGPTAASSFTVVSSSEITVASPAESAGVVQVTVTTPVGTSATSSADEFTYEPAPSVSAVSPVAGLPAGGTVVAVAGAGFNGASAVDFGSSLATDYTINSATSITAVSPAESAGTADVIVTTPVGVSTTSPADHFTYESAPTISSLGPMAGPTTGGTSVTITGTGFGAVSAVSFGTSPATITASSSASITVSAPAGSGTVDLSVTTPVGTSAATAADLFTYEPAPAVSALAPAAGLLAGGATVTITGANFTDASGVSFGSVPASAYTVVSPTQVIAVSSPQAAGTVDVTVTTPVATSTISAPDEFTYEPAPTISALSPAAGLPAGGTLVTITGTGFTAASGVSFGSLASAGYSFVSPTQLTAVSPAGSGSVDVTVTTPAGTSATSLSDEFTYETAPVVSAISPTSGPTAGGAAVTITGSNFTDASAVFFGTTAAASYTVNSATQLTASAPPMPAGTIDVTVTTPVATSASSAVDEFTYESTPSVTALSPVAGPPAGATTVTITGTNFTGATGVNFGSQPATTITVVSPTEITAVSPAESEGEVDVTVTTGTGTSATVPADQYTYELGPTVSTVSPLAGLPAGGTPVTITGTNFTGASAVDFGAVPAGPTSFTVVSSTEITVASPGQSAGTVDITVVTPDGTSLTSIADEFTYEEVPVVTSLAPIAGLPAGASSVTITGTNFTDSTGVSFGSDAAASYTVVSATDIVASAPPEPAGVVDVIVTSPTGSSPVVPADEFAYEAAPTLSSLSPAAGLPTGGVTVTINGTGFVGTSAVHFGADAAVFTVVSADEITATAPAGAAGSIAVSVTTPSGTSGASLGSEFTYETVPVVSALSPVAGLTIGGSSVTITGTGFTNTSGVDFGTNPATSYVVTSPTEIIANDPAGPAGTIEVTVTTPNGPSTANPPGDEFTYEAAPVVTAIGPVAGPTAGGTSVIITGTNLTGASAVDFGATAAVITATSATSITATSPAEPADLVDVIVTTPVGTSATTAADNFSYESAPSVTALAPVAGPTAGGTSVVMTGTGFTGASAVDFGALPAASYIVDSSTRITAAAPAGPDGTVDVTVTTPLATSTANPPGDEFTYEAAPSVTALSPVVGPLGGDTPVTITGTDFTDATGVSFGSTAASSYTFDSATQITATSPAEAAGKVYVTVTNPVGTSATSATGQFSYEGAPTVSAVAPLAGPTTGATSVTITGTGFAGASAVSFGSSATTSFTVDSATEITVSAPAGSAGTVDVSVTNTSGTSPVNSPDDDFTYEPSPSVSSLSPVAGPTTGGSSVTITGTNFTGASAVMFASTPAVAYTVNSATQITATSPAEPASIVEVTVTTPAGTSVTSLADEFTYEAAASVSAVSPVAGPLEGASTVTITGTGFNGATGVSFGSSAATSFTVESYTTISAVSPANSAGTLDVRVTTPAGTSPVATADEFTYETAPSVASLSPFAGPTSGASTVTIRGTGFTGASAVSFAATAATSFTVVSSSEITAVSPPASAGPADVIVTTPSGTNTTPAADVFTYEVAPSVTGLSPTAGPTTGGTTVLVTGTSFVGASAVNFGATSASVYSVTSPSTITVTAPAGPAGRSDITVTTPAGTSGTTTADEFTYELAPTVTAVTPVAGRPVGGSPVTITGTGFTVATGVSFGSTAVASYTIVSGTEITTTAPAEPAGAVDVTVTSPSGTSLASPADEFTYEVAPTISSLSPSAGPAAGGGTMTIAGTGFVGTSAVSFGSVAASIVSVSADSITVTLPAGSAGTVAVQVSTPSGTSGFSVADEFTYEEVPTVSSLSPAAGLAIGGSTVIITGTGFTGASAVEFGPTGATSFLVASPTEIVATSPAGSAGTVDLTVTTPVGTSTISVADEFTYEGAPSVTAVTPVAGLVTGGTAVTVSGTSFTGASAVHFGTVSAGTGSYTVVSSSEITLTTPAGLSGQRRRHRHHPGGHECHLCCGPVQLRGCSCRHLFESCGRSERRWQRGRHLRYGIHRCQRGRLRQYSRPRATPSTRLL